MTSLYLSLVSPAANEASVKTWSPTEIIKWIEAKELDLPVTW